MSRVIIKIRSEYKAPKVVLALNALVFILGVLAIGSMVMLHGGFNPKRLFLSPDALHIIQVAIVVAFILDRIARMVLARNRWLHLKNNWLDFTLILLLLIGLGINLGFPNRLLSAGAIYLIITQTYLLTVFALELIQANIRLADSGLPSSWLIIGSFLALCLVGAALLCLPAAVKPAYHDTWYFGQALFTSVSATCVTGLTVVDTGEHFTRFGHCVILGLIQLGGLGIMIFGTMLALLTGKALTLKGSDTVGQMLSVDQRLGQLGRTLRFVVIFTLIFEVIGAALMLPMFSSLVGGNGSPIHHSSEAVFQSVFHSISAFCNAGFSLYPQSLASCVKNGSGEMVYLRNFWQTTGVFCPLIILGGLGFVVLDDLFHWLGSLPGRLFKKREKFHRLNLHSKLVLTSTVILIVLGAAGLLALEFAPAVQTAPSRTAETHAQAWKDLSGGQRVNSAVFESVTARTAGFNTIDMGQLSNAGKLWMCGLMIIGGSPSSTAGGVKTVTIVLLVLAVIAVLRRRNHVEAFGRSIAADLLRRAITILVLYMSLVILITLLLCVSTPTEKAIDLFFESCSACGTVGLSTGLTQRLSPFAQGLLVVGMFVGRVGPLTLLAALSTTVKTTNYQYPREDVLIG